MIDKISNNIGKISITIVAVILIGMYVHNSRVETETRDINSDTTDTVVYVPTSAPEEAIVEITPEPVIEMTPEPVIEVESEPVKHTLLGEFEITAYCPCVECSEGYGRQTATGATATQGRTIAVDPSVIPYGTKVLINGNTYVAEDCGGAVKGNILDIFFDNHEDTEIWGRRYYDVYIVNE